MSAEQSPSPVPRYSPGDYGLALNRDTRALRRCLAADREALERSVGPLDLHEISGTIDEHERGAETLIRDWFNAAHDGQDFPVSADSGGAVECFADPLTRVYDKLRAFYPEGTANREYPAYRLHLALGSYLSRWGRCLPHCLENQVRPDDDFRRFVRTLAPAAKPGNKEPSEPSPLATPEAPAVNDDSHLSPAKLAEVFGVPGNALRKRLDRWRATNHDGWIENPDRGSREAKYLCRVGAVRPIIDAMRASLKEQH